MRFAANISWLFKEVPCLVSRYLPAKNAGFSGVEFAAPYSTPLEELVAEKLKVGVEQVLMNACIGDPSRGDNGLAALPGREEDFKRELDLAFRYAKSMECKRLHVMAGYCTNQSDPAIMRDVYIKNLKYAANLAEKDNIVVLIEPINTRSFPNYFLDCPQKAVDIIQAVDHPNLKLLMDLFHMQMITGNISVNLEKYIPYVGHIQVAQAPDRGEPDSEGEINYDQIFSQLKQLGYSGWIGLEYKPVGNTEEGLATLKPLVMKYSSENGSAS